MHVTVTLAEIFVTHEMGFEFENAAGGESKSNNFEERNWYFNENVFREG